MEEELMLDSSFNNIKEKTIKRSNMKKNSVLINDNGNKDLSKNKTKEKLDNTEISFELESLKSFLIQLMNKLKADKFDSADLSERIDDIILKEKKSNNKMNELRREIEILKNSLEKKNNIEIEFKSKLETFKFDYENLSNNLTIANQYKKQHEELDRECNVLSTQNRELNKMVNYLTEQNKKNMKIIEEMQMTIDQYKNLLNEISDKKNNNKKEKSNLQEEMLEIKGKLKAITNLNSDFKSDENVKLTNLEKEKQIFLHKENYYKNEIKSLNESLKKYKLDLKKELDEKIAIIKEFENLRITQLHFNENHKNLKIDVEAAHEEIENLSNQINILTLEKEELDLKYNSNLIEFEEVKTQYSELYDEYNKILVENNEYKEFNVNKNHSDLEIYKIIDKFEEESFNLKCENNQLKNLLLDIINLQVSNGEYLQVANILNIDENYLSNTPDNIKSNIDKIYNYFRTLLLKDKQNYSIKMLADDLVQEQNNNKDLLIKLKNEVKVRRKIQNQYLNIRGNFRVICRVRPLVYENEKNTKIIASFSSSYEISNEFIKLRDDKKSKKYSFDYVLGQKSTQQDLYEEASILVDSFINGKNVSIIAYGQTSTGKTYSVHGKLNESPGIAFRVVNDIFEKLKKNNIRNDNQYENEECDENESYSRNCISDFECSDSVGNRNSENFMKKQMKNFKLSVSIIEIYNETIYNLLAESTPALKIFENSNLENLVIPELNPIKIQNFDEATKLFKLAKTFRKTKITNYNEHSSRSHLIYTFHLKILDDQGKITRSKLNIVDLAGSERLSKIEGIMDENIKKESLFINSSLNTLSNVLNAIASKNTHIPYRDSKLTHFLKDSLCDKFLIMLVIHISPNIKDFIENLSTLEFGHRLYKLCKPKSNKMS